MTSDASHETGRPATGHGQPRLKLRVTPAAEQALRAGHPWLYADRIREQNRAGQLGELGVVYDRKDRFLALGLYDPDSRIRLRALHTGKPEPVNREWWARRLEHALQKRRTLFDEGTTGFRWINGESDDWPGLVLDRYHTTLVLKIYTAAWLPRLEEILGFIREALRPERIVLRLSRNIQETANTHFQRNDGSILEGPPLEGAVVFRETGIQFEADVLRGQKTGFFLDQRENRRKVESLARGRRVLNAFSFSGGFSLYAARGGAASVTDIDISAHALASAKRNFELNKEISTVSGCPHESVRADAFDWLAGNATRKFGLIVLDPPSLAKREPERPGALRAYERLSSLALSHLEPEGLLVACSCSAHVSVDEFYESVRRAALKTGRRFSEMAATRHAPDHPAAFPEAQYLKATYLEFKT